MELLYRIVGVSPKSKASIHYCQGEKNEGKKKKFGKTWH
jgi:hypothetical protein